MNIDKHRRTPQTLKYLDTLLSYCAYPIITLPTRVTDHSSTIIDHIIINYTLHKITSVILPTYSISDHFPIFCNIKKCMSLSPSYIFIRDNSKFDVGAFKEDMQITLKDLVNKQPTLNVANFNTNLLNFVLSVKSVIDRHAPLKKLSRRQRRLKSKPWITKGLFTSIKNLFKK